MKKRWIVLLATVMVFAFAAGAVAGPAVTNITANLANDFKFTLNGEAWTPTDGGNAMAPIVYNDRTYLPVRAIAEALDIKVDWDEATRTVVLGEAAVAPVEEEPAAPVEEEPAAPVEEEPAAPAAELAIEPTAVDFSKGNPADVEIAVTWGDATKLEAVTAVAPAFGLELKGIKEGEHYTVADNTVVIKKELTSLIPIPLSAVPSSTKLDVTLKFDTGDKVVTFTVVD